MSTCRGNNKNSSNHRFGCTCLGCWESNAWSRHASTECQTSRVYKNESVRTSVWDIWKARRTISALRVLFAFSTGKNEEQIEFYVIFDIFSGDLPFLTGLPSFCTMKATLNFRTANISLVVTRMICCPNLSEQYSQHCSPLGDKCSHQRPLRNNQTVPHYHVHKYPNVSKASH